MRFREWLVLNEASQQETQALKILGGDESLLARLKSISPEPKFLPVLALLHREQPDLAQLGKDWRDYMKLLDKKKMPTLAVQGDRIVTPPQNHPITHLQWTEKVHAMSGDAEMVRKRLDIDHSQWKPPIFRNDTLEVYETDGPGDCIRYGKGYSFCISQPGNTFWQKYRDDKTSTFYFVYDKSRPDTDPLHIVVVDITKDGPILTDAQNTTGNIAQYNDNARGYLEHLYERGVPKDLFRNKPHTKEERVEMRLLGGQNERLDWFKALSPDHKSKYIGRGRELTDEQFDYIFDNGMESLVKQYAEMGTRLGRHQMGKVLKSKFRSTYLHFRLIANQNREDISLEEYEWLKEDQKKRFGPKSMIRMLVEEGHVERANKHISSMDHFGGRLFGDLRKQFYFELDEDLPVEDHELLLGYLLAEESADGNGEGPEGVSSIYHFPCLLSDDWYKLEEHGLEYIQNNIADVREALLRSCIGRCFWESEGADGIYVVQFDGKARLSFTDCADGCGWGEGCHGPWMYDCDASAAVFEKMVRFAEKHFDLDCHDENIKAIESSLRANPG